MSVFRTFPAYKAYTLAVLKSLRNLKEQVHSNWVVLWAKLSSNSAHCWESRILGPLKPYCSFHFLASLKITFETFINLFCSPSFSCKIRRLRMPQVKNHSQNAAFQRHGTSPSLRKAASSAAAADAAASASWSTMMPSATKSLPPKQ